MSDAPKRFKERTDYTPDETLAAVQAQRRGEPAPRFETDEYKAAKREALEHAGLDPDDEPDKDLEAMSVDDHLRRIQAGRRL